MRAVSECYPCLEKLARKTCDLVKNEGFRRGEALTKGLDYLAKNFSENRIPAGLAAEFQRIIRNVTGSRDPFAAIKKKEIEISRKLYDEFHPSAGASLDELVAFSAKGNSIDYFVSMDTTRDEMAKPFAFSLDDTAGLFDILNRFKEDQNRRKLLFLADNAGECFFDLPLAKRLEQFADVFYVVKGGPVQNDLTLKDLEDSGIAGEFSRVVTTGTDSPGLDLSIASPSFMDLLESADLLFAKGMGHYETLPELSPGIPVFLLLKAKCNPVALSLNVPLNSYVGKLIPGRL